MRHIMLITSLQVFFIFSFGQQTKFLNSLIDSFPEEKPVILNLPVDEKFNALERIAITQDGKNIYYGVRNGYDTGSIVKIQMISYINENWSEPVTVFSNKAGAPYLSDNDHTIIFQYDHPNSPAGVISTFNDNKWSAPVAFSDSIKESHYLQKTTSGKFYYSAAYNSELQLRDIYSLEINGPDTSISKLGFNLKGGCCTDIFVSQDDSYIILSMFMKQNQSQYEFIGKGAELFISFKNDKDNWSTPINLGEEINGLSDYTWGPFVSNDNKYLFFSSWNESINIGTYMIRFDNLLEKYRKRAIY